MVGGTRGAFFIRRRGNIKKETKMVIPLVMMVMMMLPVTKTMSNVERKDLRMEAEDMFYHGFNAYMERAWPADELMPLSCKGRFRGKEPNRGDIDDALGNFSLTLIDSLDMLVVLGDLPAFESAVQKVITTVTFDSDIVVSVFETNIRIIGGLVSAHVLAELVQSRHGVLSWYRGELLNMAVDCATRLLPAFNSTTGLPYPRVNLRTGLKGVDSIQLTCTACAGSMILEFAALSRLTGEKIFEEKASRAMDVLWSSRHRQSNLVGNVLNVNTGDWVRRDSGVGAGIDSYYEYVAKAYVLLGEEKYLERWNTHYSAVMKYLGVGGAGGRLMVDVHMHRPNTNSKQFADALGAFWPGLQVLMGDLKPAIEQHEVLYQIMQRHHFLPEAFTADYQVHWGQHLLRPEFVESTYFLYKATRDPHYLDVGKKVLKSLQKYARVTCGYAAVKDVRTLQHEDRMDSFVLTETFKYLYLLFAEEEDLFLDMEQFVFTTEAHLLPLTLARLSNTTVVPVVDGWDDPEDDDVEYDMACPSTRYMFPDHDSVHSGAASLRKPLEKIVEATCPTRKIVQRKLSAQDFQSTNEEHLKLVKNMGIQIITLPDGRVQLLHTFANAKTPEDGEEGLLFMQEMIELSKQQASAPESPPKMVSFSLPGYTATRQSLQAGPAQFGKELSQGVSVTGRVVLANNIKCCSGSLQNGGSMMGNIVLVERGDCMFVEKARVIQSLGAVGGIVMDTTEGSSAVSSPMFAMSGDGVDDINIPMVFLFTQETKSLLHILKKFPDIEVTLEEKPIDSDAAAPRDDSDDNFDDSEESNETLKSAVHAFLEKNIRESDSSPSDGSEDILKVRVDNDTGDIISEKVQIIRAPDGSSKTIKTVEKIKDGIVRMENTVGEVKIVKIEEMLNIKDMEELPPPLDPSFSVPNVIGDINNTEKDLEALTGKIIDDIEDAVDETNTKDNPIKDIPNFSDITEFLKPASEVLDVVMKQAAMNSEMMSVFSTIPFTDLTKVFKILIETTDSLESAYTSLFQGAETMGAKKFVDMILSEEEHGDDDDFLVQLMENMGVDGSENIAKLLGNDKMIQLVTEYVRNARSDFDINPDKLSTTVNKIIQGMTGGKTKKRNVRDPSP